MRYEPVSQTDIAVVEDGVRGLTNTAEAKDNDKKKDDDKVQSRFSLSTLRNAAAGKNETKQSAAVTGSGASRGVDKELMAMGGGNPNAVAVNLGNAEIADFIKQWKLIG